MNFKKLALAAAVAATPVAGFSMEAIEDTLLSDMTGQDGITIEIITPTAGITGDVQIHDKDGLSYTDYTITGSTKTAVTRTAYSFGGAIVIDDFAVGVGNVSPITIDIDAGDNAAASNTPMLNVRVTLPAALTITTGSIKVANSQRDVGATTSWGVGSYSAAIMNSMTITLGSTTMNIQLGNEAQVGSDATTDMIVVNGTVTGGLNISSFALNDSSVGGGAIAISSIAVDDAGAGTDLGVLAEVNVTSANGLVITLGQAGVAGSVAGTSGMDVKLTGVALGTATAIGDVSIVGLNLNGTQLRVRGH